MILPHGLSGQAPWCKGLTAETDTRVAEISKSKLGIKPWNAGLTKQTDERVRLTYKTKSKEF